MMLRFELHNHGVHLRDKPKPLAEGVRLSDGCVVLYIKDHEPSVWLYDSVEELRQCTESVRVIWLDDSHVEAETAFGRGRVAWGVDFIGGASFRSVGGPDQRHRFGEVVPGDVAQQDEAYRADWLDGYRDGAMSQLGFDWQTCSAVLCSEVLDL